MASGRGGGYSGTGRLGAGATSTVRSTFAALAVCLAAAALGACSSDDTGPSAAAAAASPSSQPAGGGAATSTTVAPTPEERPVLPVTVTDSTGAQVTITSVDRVIPLDGDLAEVVFALGMGDRVVATDLSATYPAEADARPEIGYQRAPAEPIAAFDPTLLLATDLVGPPETIDALRGPGIPLVVLDPPSDPSGPATKIRQVAQALGVPGRGEQLARDTQGRIDAARRAGDAAAATGGRPRVMALYLRGERVQVVFGRGSGVDWQIAVAGGTDVGTELGVDDNAPLTAEAVLRAAPDVFLVSTTGLESVGGIDGLLAINGLTAPPPANGARCSPTTTSTSSAKALAPAPCSRSSSPPSTRGRVTVRPPPRPQEADRDIAPTGRSGPRPRRRLRRLPHPRPARWRSRSGSASSRNLSHRHGFRGRSRARSTGRAIGRRRAGHDPTGWPGVAAMKVPHGANALGVGGSRRRCPGHRHGVLRRRRRTGFRRVHDNRGSSGVVRPDLVDVGRADHHGADDDRRHHGDNGRRGPPPPPRQR